MPRTDAPADEREFDALLAGARSGEAQAWNRLYAWLAPAIAGYLRVQGARDVDDLTSGVFLGMLRTLDRFAGDTAAFRSWVFVIAHRRLQDERRRLRLRPDPLPLDAAGDRARGDAETEALARLATRRVEDQCRALAPDQRDVLLLRLVGDLTVEQVAAVLGKSQGAVKALQRRGLEAIRRSAARQGVPL